ncbi:MAG: hypothetical protein H6713_04010 [Myxococcales bacterium]|nr:hypothetical protein [Myxococcales bacterium]
MPSRPPLTARLGPRSTASLLAALLLASCFQDPGPQDTSNTSGSTTDAATTTTTGETSGTSSTGEPTTNGPTTAVDETTGAPSATTTTTTGSVTTASATTDPVIECTPPSANCDLDPEGDCETDLNTSPAHCGACDTPCDGACIDGVCAGPRLVFVSSVSAAGLGGPEGADSFCNGRASVAGLPGTYAAWLSDQFTSPSTRFTPSKGPYVLLDDTVIADNWDDLISGSIKSAIIITESGNPLPAGTCEEHGVWTGTTAQGTYAGEDDCDGWHSTDPALSGLVLGAADKQNQEWTQGGCPERGCDKPARLYCFQQ